MNELNLPPTIPSADMLPTASEIAPSSASYSRPGVITLLHYVAIGRQWQDSARAGWMLAANLTAQLYDTAKQRDEARKLAAENIEASLSRQTLDEARAECDDLRRELEAAREQLAERDASIAAHIRSANANLSNYSNACCELDALRAELRKLGGSQ